MSNEPKISALRKFRLEFRIVIAAKVVFTVESVTFIEPVRRSINVLGEYFVFFGEVAQASKGAWKRRALFIRQCEYIGVTSTSILIVAAVFLGGVLGYQLYVSFKMFSAEALLGGTVGIALFRELAPVMAGVLVTGRSGAAMAAQIASMRITEQVDALEVMAVNPIEFLVLPRMLAGFLMMPILSVFFGAVGSLAAMGVACGVMDLSYASFWSQYAKTVDALDLFHCVTKGAVFGLVFTWTGCFCGYRAQGGALAVGEAAKTTVVASCLIILLCDFVLTSFLPFGFEKLMMK